MPKQRTMWFYEDCVVQVCDEDIPSMLNTPKPPLLTIDLNVTVTL